MPMPAAECFVVIYKLRDGLFRPAWYRPAPFPGDPSHVWRFVMGGIHKEGYPELKLAQIQAKALGTNIASMSTDALGKLSCPPDNVVLRRVLNAPYSIGVMVLPAFGPGTSHTLLDVLDKSGQKLMVH